MASADTASGKFKAGFSGLMSEFRNSREAQTAVARARVDSIRSAKLPTHNVPKTAKKVQA